MNGFLICSLIREAGSEKTQWTRVRQQVRILSAKMRGAEARTVRRKVERTPGVTTWRQKNRLAQVPILVKVDERNLIEP